jgi:opacity protein-like surface antigen
MINKRRIAIMSFILFILPFCAHAQAYYKNLSSPLPNYLRNAEVSFGVGPTFYRVNKGHIQVSQYERDTSDPTHIATTAVYRLGFGYYIFQNWFTPDSFFNSLLAELNLYHSNMNIKGNVYQSGQLDLQNYTFHAPFSSTSLMLDFKPGFLTYGNFSPYAILGLGVGWNQIYYREAVASPDVPADSFISLTSRTKQDFTYDLGLGVRYPFTKNISGSLEYIYNHLGNATPNSTSGSSASRTNIQIPPTFTLYNQSIFFNVIYNFL